MPLGRWKWRNDGRRSNSWLSSHFGRMISDRRKSAAGCRIDILSPRAFHEVALIFYWILSRFIFADPGITCGVLPVCFPNLSLTLSFLCVRGALNVNSLLPNLFGEVLASRTACRPTPPNPIELQGQLGTRFTSDATATKSLNLLIPASLPTLSVTRPSTIPLEDRSPSLNSTPPCSQL